MPVTGATFEAKPETARGRAMYEMLLAVHALIRRDLERVQGSRLGPSTASTPRSFAGSSTSSSAAASCGG